MLLLTQSTDMGGGMHRGKCVVVGGYTDFFFSLAARVERECPRGAVGGALACARLA